MKNHDLLAALSERPLLCDGAMGSQLIAVGMTTDQCGEQWNVDEPAKIESIHQRYREAGCDLITTNTFGGTRTMLARHGLADQVDAFNRAAAQVARRAVGDDGWVLGDVGPFGDFLEPMGTTTADELKEVFGQQIAALVDGGANAIVVETMADPTELTLAVQVAKQLTDLPIIATYSFQSSPNGSFNTMMGTTVEQAMRAAIDAGADIVGTNCGTSLSLDDYRQLARQLVEAVSEVPVIVQANAGTPDAVDGQLVYPATPQEMAQLATDLLDTGVRVVGGCCGTTPEHLRAMHL